MLSENIKFGDFEVANIYQLQNDNKHLKRDSFK